MVVHKHLIVKAEVKNPIVNPEIAIDWLRRLVDAIDMNITEHGGPYCDYVEKKGNKGIAAIVMIETSHISLHVWDKEEPPYAQIDVYSCADFEWLDVIEFIKEMNATKIRFQLLDRGEMKTELSGTLFPNKEM